MLATVTSSKGKEGAPKWLKTLLLHFCDDLWKDSNVFAKDKLVDVARDSFAYAPLTSLDSNAPSRALL